MKLQIHWSSSDVNKIMDEKNETLNSLESCEYKTEIIVCLSNATLTWATLALHRLIQIQIQIQVVYYSDQPIRIQYNH